MMVKRSPEIFEKGREKSLKKAGVGVPNFPSYLVVNQRLNDPRLTTDEFFTTPSGNPILGLFRTGRLEISGESPVII